ncbi:molybdopterin adenylyltransferase [Methylobacterium nodulans]|uniref:Molybdopterin adenylyltransferase n=1 Tax=Methylobacterium nodulans (strain LMG 21967 / CNCM I-2342 / ORS 2060) TaxID=460265 RepID=B8IUN8_METNO|nr:molybdopterin adenylyltransferase [Methylobacterium nodulans]ACL57106.1 molybdenum cofactor synthesis domain protein [Methylobacterium nodulans ORS 2060]
MRVARIGILTVSDRAAAGLYADEGGPAIRDELGRMLTSPWEPVTRLVPDGLDSVRDAIVGLVDREGCDLVLTTGGTGPAPRDLTPEGTQAACERMMPGFGELLRARSLEQVPTAILSRQVAGIRGRALVVNLPGRPSSIRVSLLAIMPAVPYCLDLIGAARIETDPAVVRAFRPA